MLYELTAIVRITNPAHHAHEAKQVASTIGKMILNNRGVIRSIESLGTRTLPKIMRKDQEHHFQGYHFMLNFDSSAGVQSEISRTLRLDPRVIRSNIIKVDTSRSLNVLNSIEKLQEH